MGDDEVTQAACREWPYLAETDSWSIRAGPPLTLEGLRQAYRWYLEATDETGVEALEAMRAAYQEVTEHLEILGRPPVNSLADALAVRLSVQSPWRWPEEEADNVTHELLELLRQGDEAGFRALAGCVMPAEEITACWHGAQARIKEGHRGAR